MNALFDHKLAPLTFKWAFLEAELDAVSEAVTMWRQSHGRRLTLTKHSGNLDQLLLKLLPLTSPSNRELLVATKSKWTAYFDNHRLGGDVATPTRYLAKHMSCYGIVIAAVPNTISQNHNSKGGLYGAVQMSLYGPEEVRYSNLVRSIGSIHDGGKWVFESLGELQNWEEARPYSSRRIQDRFTPPMLERYCKHFGLDVFNPQFYMQKGILVESDEPVSLVQTIEERQGQIGLSAITSINGGRPFKRSQI